MYEKEELRNPCIKKEEIFLKI